MATFAAYATSIGHSLLAWDDDRIVVSDPQLRTVSLTGLVDFFTQIKHEAYQPLHRLSYWIDVPWAGIDASVLHATNVVLWSLGIGVWARVFVRMGLTATAAALAALWAGLHPAQVEAVSWVTSRKDCLALLLCGLSTLWHLRGTVTGRWVSLVFYVMAALSKTSSLPLPIVLLAYDVLRSGSPFWHALKRHAIGLAVGAVLSWLLFGIWHDAQLVRPAPGGNRLELVLATIGHYLRSTLIPAELAPLYPIWRSSEAVDDGLIAWGVVMVLAVVVSAVFRKTLLCFVTLSFLVMLLPVSNLVPTYFQRADRYVSLALLWPAFGLGCALDALTSRAARTTATLSVAAWVIALCSLNLRYQPAWADDQTLWRHATAAQPQAFYAWLKLGQAERAAGKYEPALAAFENAIAAEPTLVLGHSALFHLVVHHELGPQRQALAEQLAASYHAGISDPAALQELSARLRSLGAARSAELATRAALPDTRTPPDTRSAQ